MTGAPKKFVFDTVFDGDGDVIAHTPRPRRLIPADEVEGLLDEAFRKGERSAVVAAEQAAAAALQAMAERVSEAMPTLAAVAHGHRAASAQLAMAASRKIADAALDRFPEAPAVAALEALAREIEAEPKLIVHAPAELVERLQGALEATAAAQGYPGHILVRAGAGLASAAFIFDWGDGRAAFDPEASAARVADALATALAAEGLHGEPLSLSEPPPTPERQDDHG